MNLDLLKSKVVWASVLGAATYLLQQPQIGITEILTAVATVLGAAGVRDAWSKNGRI